MQIIAFGVDKQWDPAVKHRELYLVIYDGTWWRIMWEKEHIYVCGCVCVTGSLCCAVEIDKTLWINYNWKNKNHLKKKNYAWSETKCNLKLSESFKS